MSGPDLSLNRLYLRSDASGPRLRVGVMLNGHHAQRFARQILTDIRASNFAELACVIENCAPPAQAARAGRSRLQRIAAHVLDSAQRKRLLYMAYLRWIDSRYRPEPNPVTQLDCSDLLEGVPRVMVTPVTTRFVDRFPPESVAAIKALDLDVILRFGFRIIRGEVLGSARYGVWSFHHDDSSRYRGGPPQLWELMEGNPVSGAVLQKLEDALDAGPVLGYVNLSSASVPSVSMNRFNVYWATQHLVIRKLYELHRHGPDHLARGIIEHREYHGRKAIYRTPNNLEMGRWLLSTAARKARNRITRVAKRVAHWQIALRRSKQPLHSTDSPDLRSFEWLRSPRGHFWADPFLLERHGTMWVFFENFSYALKRAVISCGRLDDAGRLLDVRTVLDRPYHLSYPHVFEHEGEVWMIPETCAAGRVDLYRATRFPDEWTFERTLVDLPAADATCFRHEERWWMFLAPRMGPSQMPLTLLFTAPDLQGPWSLHPASAVCSDVRWSRSAGKVFLDGGVLVRPSQDCSSAYGYSVSFNRIVRLNEREYAEERGRTILPHSKRGLAGFHTYNRVGDWEIVDGKFTLARRAVA
jgi:hypothetical protein